MDWAMLGLMLGWIGIVAGAAWRFGRVEQRIANLEEADSQIRVDIRKLDQRLTTEISEVRVEVRDVRQEVRDVRQDVRDVREDIGDVREVVQRILERMPPPAD